MFIERLKPGDVIWTPYGPTGDHLVVVWVTEQRAAGLGRNGHHLAEGRLVMEAGRPFLIEDDGDTFDLNEGTPARIGVPDVAAPLAPHQLPCPHDRLHGTTAALADAFDTVTGP